MSVISITGGCFRHLAELPNMAQHIILYTDAAKEIKVLDPPSTAHNIRALSVGEGLTVDTLIAKMKGYPNCEGLARAYKRMGSTTFAEGMAQNANFGRMCLMLKDKVETSGLDVIRRQQSELEEIIISSIYQPLLLETNGTIGNVELMALHSINGGAGGGMGIYMADKIAKIISDKSGATVNMSVYIVGENAFEGLGHMIHGNAGRRLAELLAYILSPTRPKNQTRRAFCLEIRNVVEDAELRSMYTTQVFQAMLAPDVTRKLGIFLPNTSNPLDGIILVRAGLGNNIPENFIRAMVVRKYGEIIGDLITDLPPDKSVCESVALREAIVGTMLTLDEFKTAFKGSKKLPSANEILQSLAYTFAVFVNRSGKKPIEIASANFETFGLPETLAEYKGTAAMFLGLKEALNTEKQTWQVELDSTNETITSAQKEIEGLQSASLDLEEAPEGWKSVLESGRSKTRRTRANNEKRRNRDQAIDAQLTTLYNNIAKAHKVRAAIRAINNAIQVVQDAFDGYQSGIKKMLRDIASVEDTNGFTPDLLAVKAIEDSFDFLLKASEIGDKKLVKEILENSADGLALEALAMIAGMETETTITPRSLISYLVNNPPPFPGPNWGGQAHLDYNKKVSFIVLPPVTDTLRMDLENALQDLGLEDRYQIAEVESVAAGINIVWLDYYGVNNVNEVETPKYRDGINTANLNPLIHNLPDLQEEVEAIIKEVEKAYDFEKNFEEIPVTTGPGESEEKEAKKE